MRNLILLFLLIIVSIFSGIFIVDEREVAVNIRDSQHIKVYTTGLHWRIPFMGETRYVYTNLRHSYFSAPEPIVLNNVQLTGQYVFAWYVNNPKSYALYLQQNPGVNFATVLANEVYNVIKEQNKHVTSYDAFENKLLNWHQLTLPQYGVVINNVNLSNTNLESINIESGTLLNKSPESAYIAAQNIVKDADLQYQQNLDSLREINPALLDFMVKIDTIKSSAESKQDVPPLEKLIINK